MHIGKNGDVSAILRCTGRAATASLLFLGIAGAARGAEASCVAPVLSADVASGPAGGVVEIRGQYFGTDCNDVVIAGTPAGPPLGEPQTDIRLVIVQDDVEIPLISTNPINADSDYSFAVQITLPSQLHAGAATIRADREPGIELPFTITTATAATTTTTTSTTTTAPAVVLGAVNNDPPATAPSHAGSRFWPWISTAIGLGLGATAIVLMRSRQRAHKPAI